MARCHFTLRLHGRQISLSLEKDFWECLKEIASARGQTLSALAADIAGGRNDPNLTSTFRIFILGYYRQPAVDHRATDAAGLR